MDISITNLYTIGRWLFHKFHRYIQYSITIENSFMESGIADKLNGVSVKNISYYNGGNNYTNEIELLELGLCESDVEPPIEF